MVAMADITETRTGQKVGVPLEHKTDVMLVKRLPYWRAFFFKIGLGLPPELIADRHLKAAKEGDYSVSLMEKGKVVWEG